MQFKNIDFHNVEELQPCEKGYSMNRLPASVREQVNEGIRKETSYFSTGIELRFKIKQGEAVITLRADECAEAQTVFIYYGSFQGGWQHSAKTIGWQDTRITIPKAGNLDVLKKITAEQGLAFDPELVRLVLPYGTCYFVDIEGDIELPTADELPKQTYLAYGSSITHGSLALAAPYTYPFRIAQKLNCDYLNLGFAGTAHLEKSMAEYLVSRKDWSFASIEMGINMLSEKFSLELFEDKVRDFVDILSKDSRPVFATSIFGFNGLDQSKAAEYRRIVKKYAGSKLIFTDGLDLLDNAAYISQDLVHPTLEGIESIVNHWYAVMDKKLSLTR